MTFVSPLTFDPHIHLQRIVMVGIGGTGSHLARLLARLLADRQAKRLHVPSFHLIDPDRVEAKNIGRQLFVAGDVGQFKAQTLAQKLSLSLGLEVVWSNTAFDPHCHQDRHTLVCGAVDNHLARQALAQTTGLWLDGGNHADGGQVVLGNTPNKACVLNALDHAPLLYLPHATLLFPQLLEPEPTHQPTLPCADGVQVGEQQVLVNDWMALIMAQYVYKLLYRQPIQSFMTYLDAATLSVVSVTITADTLRGHLS